MGGVPVCPPGQAGWHSGAVFEAPALVAGFDDFAVMGQAVKQRGCQSPKARLVVMMTEVRSYSRLIR